jgi:nicotinamidase/pyrazinamidase
MKTAFIAVDVQNDFCEGGSLPVTGGGDVARAISRHLAEHGDEYTTIVATRDYHIDPGDHFADDPDFVTTWPAHCVAGTPGASFHPDLDVTLLDTVVSKGAHEAAYSGFEGTVDHLMTLEEVLRDQTIARVEIAGLATDHCVRATALDAVKAGFETTVRLDLSVGVAPETTAAAIAEMRAAGVDLIGA